MITLPFGNHLPAEDLINPTAPSSFDTTKARLPSARRIGGMCRTSPVSNQPDF
jgi:hypothetical protein